MKLFKAIRGIAILVVFGILISNVYAGITIEEKSFDPQPEPPGISSILAGNPVTLPDGSKLELMEDGKGSRVYLIKKNGTKRLADGIFKLPDGKQLTINNGIIFEGRQ